MFLTKLDHFLAAFAARSDGKPWLRDVDIGSLAIGARATVVRQSASSMGYAALERHVDLHLKLISVARRW